MKKLLELEMKYPKEIKMAQPLKFALKSLLLCLFFGGISTSLEAAPLASSFSDIAFNTVNTLDNTQAAEMIPNASFSLESLGRGILGMLFLIGISFLFSANKRAINWKMVGIGLGIQIVLAIGILKVPLIQKGFSFVGQIFVNILDYTLVGSKFLLGNLLDLNNPSIGYIFAFQAKI